MFIQERILKYITYKDITPYKFCKDLKLSMGYLDKRGAIGTDKYLKIIEHYRDLNPEWLLNGKGEMLKNQDEISSCPLMQNKTITDDSGISGDYNFTIKNEHIKKQMIPFYEINNNLNLNSFFKDNSLTPFDYICIPNAPKCDGALSFRGDSMYPTLKPGDIVCYKIITDFSNILYGEIYLLYINNEDDQYITVKYIRKSELGDEFITLCSESKYHTDTQIHISQVEAIAIIKLFIRYNSIS